MSAGAKRPRESLSEATAVAASGGGRGMRARWIAGVALAIAGTAACVDLFHSTDFTTFCTLNPTDPSCGGDGGAPTSDAAPDTGPPPLDFCSLDTARARKYAEHACTWLGACEGATGSTKTAACLTQAILAYDCNANPHLRPQGATFDLWQCLARAQSCADVDACILPGGVQPCPPVSGGGQFSACGTGPNAAVRVECRSAAGGKPTAVEPCLLAGRTCTARNGSVAECTGVTGKDCAGAPTCLGSAIVACGTGGDSAIDRGFDCKYYGAGACALTAGGPACKGNDAGACTGDGGDGTSACPSPAVATACVGGGELDTACMTLGGKCLADAGIVVSPQNAAACGGTSVGGVAPCTADDACSGSTITSCDLGIKYVVDCKAQGLGSCQTGPSGFAQCSVSL